MACRARQGFRLVAMLCYARRSYTNADPCSFFTDDSNEPRRRRAIHHTLEERHRSLQSRLAPEHRLLRASRALHGQFRVHMVRRVKNTTVPAIMTSRELQYICRDCCDECWTKMRHAPVVLDLLVVSPCEDLRMAAPIAVPIVDGERSKTCVWALISGSQLFLEIHT